MKKSSFLNQEFKDLLIQEESTMDSKFKNNKISEKIN